ncbi:IclR family transcriptional regulator [Paenibacillus sp. WQ 127069]|uniref:IclR family transcriptional regulator n=1 Tax=Paenibacillus baimaensis TaxID=2982185 RepID=A0ABT2UC32_9BACL|nr:IclR family transcriptional regulator [Paenibacillus sp. WQ 127069]MCU6791487.1 IclR family transcriptional regulator [Paenibacillus sp. WQ 127069]
MSTRKTLEILDLYTLETRELSVPQISEIMNIPQSSVYRYIRILKEKKYLMETNRGTYRLGLRFLEMNNMINLNNELSLAATPVMTQLMNETQETTVLVILSGFQTICIENISSSFHMVKVSSEPGKFIPLYAGASSKAILAYMGNDAVNKLFKHGIVQKHTENTITDKNALLDNLKDIRTLGYAESDNELDEGVYTYAVPIFSTHTIIGSLSVAGPRDRMIQKDKEQLIASLKKAAKQIEQNI